jgi:hypothetical protein
LANSWQIHAATLCTSRYDVHKGFTAAPSISVTDMREVLHGLLDHLPTEADLAEALRAWRNPARQAASQFAQSALVRVRIGDTQSPAAVMTNAVREVLLDALPCLKSARQIGSIEGSVLYRRYVLNRSVAEIAHADAIAPATLNRRVHLELAELSVVLAQMTVRLPKAIACLRT